MSVDARGGSLPFLRRWAIIRVRWLTLRRRRSLLNLACLHGLEATENFIRGVDIALDGLSLFLGEEGAVIMRRRRMGTVGVAHV